MGNMIIGIDNAIFEMDDVNKKVMDHGMKHVTLGYTY